MWWYSKRTCQLGVLVSAFDLVQTVALGQEPAQCCRTKTQNEEAVNVPDGCLFRGRGEGAFEFHSGLDGVTNAFVSRHDTAGIWAACFSRCQRHRCWQEDLLFSAVEVGSLAQLGFGAWTRSTFFGGNYELLDHANGFEPNPTFWLGVLLKRYVLVDDAVPVRT